MLPVSVLIQNRPQPYLLDAQFTVTQTADYFREHCIGGAPVVKDGKLVGFVSERDIVFRVVAEGRDPNDTKVADIMSTPVTTAAPDSTVEECEGRMREAHVRHMPILEGDKVVACISLRDLLQSELRQAEAEVRSLSEYVQGSG